MGHGERIKARVGQGKPIRAQQLANRLGVTRSTVYQWMAGGDVAPRHREPLAKELGYSQDDLFGDGKNATANIFGSRIMVVGAIHDDQVVECAEWPEKNQYQTYVPSTPQTEAYQGLKVVGFEVRSPSMNRRYPAGTLVVCATLRELGEDPKHLIDGKYYIVHQILSAKRRRCLLRRAQVVGSGRQRQIWLWPESDDPAYQSPIAFMTNPHPTLDVSHRVLYSWRPED